MEFRFFIYFFFVFFVHINNGILSFQQCYNTVKLQARCLTLEYQKFYRIKQMWIKC